MRRALRILLGSLALSMAIHPLNAQQNAPLYDEPFRPQVHFSPQRHWTNDPNGLVYFAGEYHLFFQYNPFGDEWGHMSWGHAVSRDLLHWRELPVALPEHDGEMIFTGSVVIDEHNTSGFCLHHQPCMVAIYTSHRSLGEHRQQESQSLAFSLDHGRTWTFYAQNPVLDRNMRDFRDPSVTWNAETKQWLMVVSLPNEHHVAFYGSPDLKHWTELSTFGPLGATGGQWECPDLIHLPSSATRQGLWVLKVGINPGALQGGSGEQYFLGSFDGRQFTPRDGSGSTGWSDYGKDSYCAISYNHLPDGEAPILMGWMDNWQYAADLPTQPWRGQMTLPRRLSVLEDSAGVTLAQHPIIASLREGHGTALHAQLSSSQESAALGAISVPGEMAVDFGHNVEGVFGLRFYADEDHWVEIAFDEARHMMYTDRTHLGAPLTKDFPARTEAPVAPARPRDLHIIVDRSSIEVFAQSGTIAMTNLILPPKPLGQVKIFHRGTPSTLNVQGTTWKLYSTNFKGAFRK